MTIACVSGISDASCFTFNLHQTTIMLQSRNHLYQKFIGTLPREVIYLSPIVLIAFNNTVTLRDISKEIFFSPLGAKWRRCIGAAQPTL